MHPDRLGSPRRWSYSTRHLNTSQRQNAHRSVGTESGSRNLQSFPTIHTLPACSVNIGQPNHLLYKQAARGEIPSPSQMSTHPSISIQSFLNLWQRRMALLGSQPGFSSSHGLVFGGHHTENVHAVQAILNNSRKDSTRKYLANWKCFFFVGPAKPHFTTDSG